MKMKSKVCIHCKLEFQWDSSRNPKQIYCSRKCVDIAKINKPTWNAGIGRGWLDRQGYRRIKVKINNCRKDKLEHRVIMENHLGRNLEIDEDVHHINGNRIDNRICNLLVINHGEHSRISNLRRRLAAATGDNNAHDLLITLWELRWWLVFVAMLSVVSLAALYLQTGVTNDRRGTQTDSRRAS